MDWKIELVAVPVTDVDRAKAFYVDQIGFVPEFDEVVNDDLRFVQLTPPGSACSIVVGKGVTEMAPGTQKDLLMVVSSADDAYAELTGRGVEARGPVDLGWGRFVYFADPDGNTWAVQELPKEPPVI